MPVRIRISTNDQYDRRLKTSDLDEDSIFWYEKYCSSVLPQVKLDDDILHDGGASLSTQPCSLSGMLKVASFLILFLDCVSAHVLASSMVCMCP